MLRALSRSVFRSLSSEASTYKKYSDVVGIVPDVEAPQKLIAVYQETLKACEQLPSDYLYRKNVEQMTKHRLQIVSETSSISEMEEKIGLGEIEEVLIFAHDELNLLNNVREWKAWEE
jgi:NADH dehydrogenase (ubiquinone) 1 alpha subcomplex subunit 5